ncbi:hypothetical protein [Actinomyces vulturis]|uniref:hypothetical protein n=1 Tax=Actinomyces vulturis TaxID=1857645 RepID=UPI001C40107F|nr:hypothetical protein [Actinomyces vulturis]
MPFILIIAVTILGLVSDQVSQEQLNSPGTLHAYEALFLQVKKVAMTALHPISKTDSEYLWHWLHEVKNAEWRRWDGPYFDDSLSHNSQTEFQQYEFPKFFTENKRMITHQKVPVGLVTRFEEEPQGGGWYEVGILIFDPRYWNQGIGQETRRL